MKKLYCLLNILALHSSSNNNIHEIVPPPAPTTQKEYPDRRPAGCYQGYAGGKGAGKNLPAGNGAWAGDR